MGLESVAPLLHLLKVKHLETKLMAKNLGSVWLPYGHENHPGGKQMVITQ